MSIEDKLDSIFSGDLKELMLVSYIVLSNNAVTNRFIETRFDMPVQAWSSLFAIDRFPGIRAKEIKALFPRPQNTISRAINLLESRGLVRQEASTSDGREKRVCCTDAGRALLAEMIDLSIRRQAELFAPLTAAEKETFVALARKVAQGDRLLHSAIMNGG